MGKLSRTEFVNKWIRGGPGAFTNQATQNEMISDLDDLIEHAGGNVKAAAVLTKEEKEAGVVSLEDEQKQREDEFRQPGSYMGRMRRN